MKYIFFLLLISLSFVASANYRSYSGDSYQYDMNNPYDRNLYQRDAGAQMRDMYPNVRRDLNQTLDRGVGQYGGGYYDYY